MASQKLSIWHAEVCLKSLGHALAYQKRCKEKWGFWVSQKIFWSSSQSNGGLLFFWDSQSCTSWVPLRFRSLHRSTRFFWKGLPPVSFRDVLRSNGKVLTECKAVWLHWVPKLSKSIHIRQFTSVGFHWLEIDC